MNLSLYNEQVQYGGRHSRRAPSKLHQEQRQVRYDYCTLSIDNRTCQLPYHIRYCAPEAFGTPVPLQFSFKSDVWSFGMIVYEVY